MGKPSLKKQLISSVISLALIAVFFIASVTTYSWFANSGGVTANGMQISADLAFSGSEVRLCPVTAIDEENNSYTFLSDVPVSSLPKYDKYNIGGSEYERAVVMAVTFSAAAEKINLSLTTESPFSENNIISGNDDYLSNAVSFYPVTSVAATGGESGESVATASGTAQSFLPVTKTVDGTNGYTYTFQNKVYTLSIYSDLPVSAQERAHTVYIVMTYNKNMVEYFSSKLKKDVVFKGDITIMLEKAGE